MLNGWQILIPQGLETFQPSRTQVQNEERKPKFEKAKKLDLSRRVANTKSPRKQGCKSSACDFAKLTESCEMGRRKIVKLIGQKVKQTALSDQLFHSVCGKLVGNCAAADQPISQLATLQ